MRTRTRASVWLAGAVAGWFAPTVAADALLGADRGKLLLTAGFTSIEGAGGGGLTSWALVTGYGSSSSWGANVHTTGIALRDFDYRSFGAGVGVLDRVELSFSRQMLDATAGVLDRVSLSQDIFGAKVRLLGDAVYAQDSWVPQLAVGALFKRHRGIDGGAQAGFPGLVSVKQLGASDDEGVDYYLSATKISLSHNLLTNVTLRLSDANQFGLLGFGGDRNDGRSLQAEASVGYLLRRSLVIGFEYRARARRLDVDDESDAWDAFVAWAPSRSVSVVAAYVNLGSIAAPIGGSSSDQGGAYLSAQIGF